jgi:hypothetical protein
MIAIQEYDLETRRIKGTDNHLADVLNCNPAGLNSNEIKQLSKPNTILINKVNLHIDKSICKELKNLARIQRTDTKLDDIRRG